MPSWSWSLPGRGPNTVLATGFDLKVFFSVVDKDPVDVDTADVLAFVAAQREPRHGATVVRIEDGERGLSARTIKRRLATIAGLYEYLLVRGDTSVVRNPVPRGLALRRNGGRAVRGVPLIRTPRTLPKVVDPDEANAFLAALRKHRDRAMVEAMLLGGLRRCEVLGLRLGDVHPGETAGVHRRRQGRASADRADLGAVLHRHWRPIWTRNGPGRRHRPGVRGVEGPPARSAAVGSRVGRDRRWCP